MTMEEIQKHKNAEEFVVQLPNGVYFAIQTSVERYDYTFFDQDFSELDGGVMFGYNDTLDAARSLIAEEYGYGLGDCKLCDYDDIMENLI